MIRLALSAFLFAALPATQLPFTVDATEDAAGEFPGAPRLQSFSFAQWKGRWVFIGGRSGGYHSVGGGPAEFLPADANRDVWVIDTTVKPARTYHAPVAQLPAPLTPVKEQWTSTGLLYFQDGAKLYICGGYGQDHRGKWLTFSLVSQVDLPALIQGVMLGRIPPASIAFASSSLLQSAGGELIKLADGNFYLLMGHNFTGSYTAFEGHGEHNAEEVSQTYLNEIRKLKITSDPRAGLAVHLVQRYRDQVEFHRRDLNATHFLSSRGLGLAVYGGVFTPETQLSYSKPIYLFANSPPVVDSTFEQKMNAYNCPRLLMYDETEQTMYTTFFGGISRFSWNSMTDSFVENPRVGSKIESNYLDGLQWSDQLSTIRKVMAPGKQGTTEFVHPNSLPAFVGTDAVFIPVAGAVRTQLSAGILDFNSLRQKKTLVGYIYGGIRAFPYRFPYDKTAPAYNSGAVPTRPSELILKVFVQAASP